MEYENIDESARYLKACDNVKKIVNAIKKIRMKYYINFSKISEEDRKVYDELEENLERIAEENNLNSLKNALMQEVATKYDQQKIREINDNNNSIDDRLLACYGNIDVQQKALAEGKIGLARKCQIILQEYLQEMQSDVCQKLVESYKRDKFAELVMQRVAVENKNEEFLNYMEQCFKQGNASSRKKALNQIEKNNVQSETKSGKIELEIV